MTSPTSMLRASLPPSLWSSGLTDRLPRDRPPLSDSLDVDVAIVGAGFTGLWTAIHLIEADPHLRISVLEADVVGAGASSRNGGWCSSILPMSWGQLARAGSHETAVAMQREMFRTVPMLLADLARFDIDARAHQGGWLCSATNPAHVKRLHDELDTARRWGFTDADFCWLDRHEATSRIDAAGTLGAVYTPHCAVLDPARAVIGLADHAERLGVRIHEHTRVERITGRLLETGHGVVRAEVVVRATEAFTVRFGGLHRRVLPVYSMLIATEPLPPEVWAKIGWTGREAFNDARHLLVYAQRTADGRLAFGGRGAPYHFGSHLSPRFDTDRRVHRELLPTAMRRLFPPVSDAAITHEWGGPLAAPRDWFASVGFDRSTGSAWAGGYVGDGVATAHLAGRTLADLITGHDSDLTRFPWVGHRSPDWEPEPLRWLGVNLGNRLADSADGYEERRGRSSGWRTRALGALLGR